VYYALHDREIEIG